MPRGFTISPAQRARLARLDTAWEAMTTDPERATPKILVRVPLPGLPSPEL